MAVIQPIISNDGFCGPKYNNATCAGTDNQCCNGETWKCGNQVYETSSQRRMREAYSLHSTDCQAGTCFSGGCNGFPSEYSMDGRCGVLNGNLQCGGKWGDCCSTQGKCGTGETFCGLGKCQSGNCTIIIPVPPGGPVASPTTTVLSPSSTPGAGGISTEGSCGGTNKYQCKGSPFGNCCSSSGFCGSTTGHCTAGCQVTFGYCTNPDLSPDGTCGGTSKYQCKGSGFGDCCSASGYCGSTTAHCNAGCQSTFGTCVSPDISPDGTCGGTKKYRCQGSSFGDCCSTNGNCGKTIDHCGTGCQGSFGVCSTLPICYFDDTKGQYVCPTTTATAPAQTGVSNDGTCGGSKGLKCQGSTFGNCCSSDGYCGSTINHCAQGW
jgi:hypothetical protein